MNRSEASPALGLGEEPWYSSSTNPNLGSFIEALGNSEEPRPGTLDGSISAGKNTYVYDTHTYHTKVPPAGIEAFIKAYSRPGDVILDPFCGSGMTGVAARSTGRHVILSDISPAATFIAYNFLREMPVGEWDEVCRSFLKPFGRLERALYSTTCRECAQPHKVEYTVWSYQVECPECRARFNYWSVGQALGDSVRTSRLKQEIVCPGCGRTHPKRSLRRLSFEPVQIGYYCPRKRGRQESMVKPSAQDLDVIRRINLRGIPSRMWYPKAALPIGYNTRQPIPYGIGSVDAFYTTRNLWALAALWRRASHWPDPVQRHRLLFSLTGLYLRITKFSEFRFWGGSGNAPRLYVPMVMNEQNVFETLRRKFRHIHDHLESQQYDPATHFCITTQSSSKLADLPDHSVDFIFTDPPFGGNINYSEMNFLWESWLGVYTDAKEEAVINQYQAKGVPEYQRLLRSVFVECSRVLKPGGHMVVVFNNSSERVWQSLAGALGEGGFRIQASYTFDKRHPTLKQLTAPNVAGLDVALICLPEVGPARIRRAAKPQLIEAVRSYLESAESEREGGRTARAIYGAVNGILLKEQVLAAINFQAFKEWLPNTFPEEIQKEAIPHYLKEIEKRRQSNAAQLKLL